MARPYPNSIRETARLLREAGHTYPEISRRTGAAHHTVVRWLNPEYNNRQLEANRKRKEKLKNQCQKCGKPVWYTSKLCVACAKPPRRWTKENIIKAIQEWADAHNGQPPTTREWRHAAPGRPGYTSVYGPSTPFRKWNDAIHEAGFTTTGKRSSNPGPGHLSWDPETAERLRQQGFTDTEIGRRMGVSAHAIRRKLGRRSTNPVRASKTRSRDQRIADLRKALEHQQKENTVDIGTEKETIVIEPLEEPVPREQPAAPEEPPVEAPVETPYEEPVPA